MSSNTHIEKTLPNGQSVLILNDGAIITQEDKAMLQALHSRNPKGIKEHLKTLEAKGSGNMMASFYVGYGHKSIGDCGTTTIFIEGVSMLCAKAIQDSKLYNGQECSTRYIDFSTQPFFNPNTQDTTPHEYTDKLRAFYLKALPITIEDLKLKYLIKEEEKEVVYQKAIKARAFDILRGFLPAGATTNLAWSTTLRQVADRLVYLRNHSLEEVRNIAIAIEEACIEMYPNSFGHKRYDESFVKEYQVFENPIISSTNKIILPATAKELLQKRKQYQEIPPAFGVFGQQLWQIDLDYASYRDIQRHRAVTMVMPYLDTKLGFETWYLDNLPLSLKEEATDLVDTDILSSYLLPMGYKVHLDITGDLPALVYLAEIRSSKMVHPTLRRLAIELGLKLEKELAIPIYLDTSEGDFDTKRGTNDIVEK